MQRKLYQHLATLVQARLNCIESDNNEWRDRHEERIMKLVDNHLPHGSGFDSGTRLDLDCSEPNRLVLCTSFHHMNDNGYYDGWTEHDVIVTPDLASGFDLRVTGRNKRDIKDYIHECFGQALDEMIDDAEKKAA